MTRKLTDEQVKKVSKISFDKDLKFYVESIDKHFTIAYVDKDSYNVYLDFQSFKKGLTKTELLVYLEEVLNAKYCWLPQQQSWIMSGEVIKFKDAGRLIELMHLAWDNDFSFYQRWFDCVKPENQPYSDYKEQHPSWWDFDEGLTVPANSPIWDAVKGVE